MALRARVDNSAVDNLYGPEPSTAAYEKALVRTLTRQVIARGELLKESVTRVDAAHRLGVSAQAVSDMLEREALIGLKEGREWRIPIWQFDPDSPTGIVPGIPELAAEFPAGVVALSRWLREPNADLEDHAPLDNLRRGDVRSVVVLARVL
jgi:hypothetical protein